MLNLDDKVKRIVTLGSATLYPGFSYKYFGEERAKAIAQQYANQRDKLSLSELSMYDEPALSMN